MWSVERFNEYDANDILFICKSEEFARQAMNKLDRASKNANYKNNRPVHIGKLEFTVLFGEKFMVEQVPYIDN